MNGVNRLLVIIFLLLGLIGHSIQSNAEPLNPENVISAQEAESHLNIQSGTTLNKVGAFVQKKFFKVLSKPFISSGEFRISDNQFSWQTLKPVKSAITYKNNQLFFEDSTGNKKAPPQADTVSRLLRTLISGNMKGLSDSFSFYVGDNTSQCVSLVPKQATMSQFIEQIDVCGNRDVETFVLYDKNKNRTEISLSYN